MLEHDVTANAFLRMMRLFYLFIIQYVSRLLGLETTLLQCKDQTTSSLYGGIKMSEVSIAHGSGRSRHLQMLI